MDIRVLQIEKRYNKGKEEHWLLYAPAGNIQNCQTWENVKRLMPPAEDSDEEEEMQRRNPAGSKLFHMRAIWSVIGPHYEAWLNGEKVTEEGVPLDAWAGANASQVKMLKRAGIHTVEHLAAASEGQMSKVNLPDLRDLKRRAATFIESADKTELADKVAESNDKLDAALDVIAEMQAKLNAMEKPQAKPKAKAAKEAA